MKKLLLLLLTILPILIGCMNQEPEQSQGTTLPFVTLPPAYYAENSEIEIATNGAVKRYDLPNEDYNGIYRIGNGLMLTTDSQPSQMYVLTGETCIPSATSQLEQESLQQCVAFSNGFAYYDVTDHSIVYLDSNLSKRHQISMTEQMTSPTISPDGSYIYYCVGQEIRAMDVEKNISRLIKTQNVENQTILGTCLDGSVLICLVRDELGNEDTLYISAKDGQTIQLENGISKLYSNQDAFMVYWEDGAIEQWVCGTVGGTAQRFLISDDSVFDAMDLGGVVGYGVREGDLALNFYTVPDGKRTASLTLSNIGEPDLLFADQWTNCIWLVVDDPDAEGKVLLKWDVSKSKVTDSNTYIDILYTASNPNQAALKELQTRVEELNNKHGVRIKIWQDALSTPGEHILEAEYQVDSIRYMLDELEAVLNEFPKKFVYNSISSRLRICLVRTVDGASEGLQYWDGKYAYIALCSGSDVRQDFLKGFGIVIDSHVLGNSPVYDYWDTLNPEGFLYGKPNVTYVTGEERYFVDHDSMLSGMTDRSRVFWQAMLPDNAELFSSESMQKKLAMLCKAIRDAWRLEKKSDVYPWEQYLDKPIAKK